MKNSKRHIITLAPLLMVILIDAMGFGLIYPILGPLFTQKTAGILSPIASLSMRDFLFGLTLGCFTLTMIISAPFLGDLSDYYGRKKVLIISLIGTCISLMISAIGIEIDSVTILIVGRVMAGFAAGSQPIAQAAIADISTSENKAVNMSWLGFVSCFGFVIGPMVGGYFTNSNWVSWFNFSTPFYVSAALALLNAIAVKFTFKETFHPVEKKQFHLFKGIMVFVSAFTSKKIRPLVIVTLFLQMGFAIYITFISIFIVQRFHYNSTTVGHFMAYFGVVAGLTYLFGVRYSLKIFGLENSVVIGFIIMALSIISLVWPAEWLIWLTVIPISGFDGIIYTALLTLYSNAVEPEAQGWVMGINAAVSAASWGVGAILAGIIGSFHSYLPFMVAATLILLALLQFIYIKHEKYLA